VYLDLLYNGDSLILIQETYLQESTLMDKLELQQMGDPTQMVVLILLRCPVVVQCHQLSLSQIFLEIRQVEAETGNKEDKPIYLLSSAELGNLPPKLSPIVLLVLEVLPLQFLLLVILLPTLMLRKLGGL
jgi:hypothetical protein